MQHRVSDELGEGDDSGAVAHGLDPVVHEVGHDQQVDHL